MQKIDGVPTNNNNNTRGESTERAPRNILSDEVNSNIIVNFNNPPAVRNNVQNSPKARDFSGERGPQGSN
jgi:hypothetical protein